MFHPAGLPPVLTDVPAAEGSGPTNLAHSTVQGTRTQLPKPSRSAWPWTEGLGRDLSLSLPPCSEAQALLPALSPGALGTPGRPCPGLCSADPCLPDTASSREIRDTPYSSPSLCSSLEHSLLSSMIASIRWEDASLILASGTQTMVV